MFEELRSTMLDRLSEVKDPESFEVNLSYLNEMNKKYPYLDLKLLCVISSAEDKIEEENNGMFFDFFLKVNTKPFKLNKESVCFECRDMYNENYSCYASNKEEIEELIQPLSKTKLKKISKKENNNLKLRYSDCNKNTQNEINKLITYLTTEDEMNNIINILNSFH